MGDVVLIDATILGSRDDLVGFESSIEDIDMLLPGRVVVEGAGSSRTPGNGGGGGGICESEARAL